MLRIITYLVFIISVAMAAGGIVLSSKLRNRHRHEIFSALLYFQVFIFTFGFYGIWGQVVIKAYLETYISAQTLSRITDISMLLGLPFLVFAWLMLTRLCCSISGRNPGNWFILIFLVLNFSIIVAVGYFMSDAEEVKPVLFLKYYFIAMNFFYSVAGFFLVLFRGSQKPVVMFSDRRIIGAALLMIMIFQCTSLIFYPGSTIIALIFVVLFFTGNAFLPVFLAYGAKLKFGKAEPEENISFEQFCRKFDVSPREKDIVREICNGLSNKEISEKLFISLQTVKDHTHRIYGKINVKSRVQLINLVKQLNP